MRIPRRGGRFKSETGRRLLNSISRINCLLQLCTTTTHHLCLSQIMAELQPNLSSDMAKDAAAQGQAPQDVANQHSILPKLIPHLDRHLVFPLLQFLEQLDNDTTDITTLKFELLKQTNMTDFVGDLYAQINGLSERPQEYVQKREDVLAKREKYQEDCSKIQDLLADQDVVNNFRSDKVANLNYLKENHGVTIEMVNALYEFGQFQYSCGDYNSASELLYQFRILVS